MTNKITDAAHDAVMDQILDAKDALRDRNRDYALFCLRLAVEILDADDGNWTETGMHKKIQKILTPSS